ncbi:nitrite/sulfite reductase [Siphonobacter aquaeclarae]|uniref:Sulfite reductase (Ferredoxin) n=1 Tax=Siphonobacter aquaeclarae TaxID=563176 RepID=A0A1G9IV56_9BACT|nr:nitrite/sulfite reductase [Siphonobacter aquaeclarae]SDL28704.1 sulfite reductase (ferredoxin) [Siphonobacter aquaeclarae]
MELQLSDRVDPAARHDILELRQVISAYRKGDLDNERFRAFRLTRGIYGQRQDGVHMIRVKLPFGRLTPEQLIRIADCADAYGHGNLHLTTRQDIQLHYVKLEDTPQLWADLEDAGITLREACGNTIRNMTGSAIAGIDPDEPFDVSPYVHAMFSYFLRNPICQDLGRKFKIAFSSSEKDTAFTFIHDLGFIPKIRTGTNGSQLGFRVLLGGGLGAQPFAATPVLDFLEEDQVIPFTEACIRIFDRYGERTRRHKARLKYLIQELGIDSFLALVESERLALGRSSFPVNRPEAEPVVPPEVDAYTGMDVPAGSLFEVWRSTNVFAQKQAGYFAVQLRISNGDLPAATARHLAQVIRTFAADDVRVTVNQGLLLKFVPAHALFPLFRALEDLALARPGFDTLHDVTACPGTDTCNLGIASSMGLARELERMLTEEYPQMITEKQLKIKISGCMNACGHHTIADIGFHGMSIRQGKLVLPGMQVLLGGAILGNGDGILAEKVIKLPSKRTPQALRVLLDDFRTHSQNQEPFHAYFARQGKAYFYTLLKPLAELEVLSQDFLLDWGEDTQYATLVGVGECAGALVDQVAIVLDETRVKLEKAREAFDRQDWVNAIYYGYSGMIHAAKAHLLTRDLPANTHHLIILHFDRLVFPEQPELGDFRNRIMQINQHAPSETFAARYLAEAEAFFERIAALRDSELADTAY